MKGNLTRQQIIESADDLFYERGFEHTSFSDIALAVNISRGNFYYHFKTKDQILDAVIDFRLSSTSEMLDEWHRAGDGPMERIFSFIQILIQNRLKIRKFGCPVGTLCSELIKLDHPAQTGASRIYMLFRTWLGRQFIQIGYGKKESDYYAMHVLAFSQGVATLANAFDDEQFILQEVKNKKQWLLEVFNAGQSRKLKSTKRNAGKTDDKLSFLLNPQPKRDIT